MRARQRTRALIIYKHTERSLKKKIKIKRLLLLRALGNFPRKMAIIEHADSLIVVVVVVVRLYILLAVIGPMRVFTPASAAARCVSVAKMARFTFLFFFLYIYN